MILSALFGSSHLWDPSLLGVFALLPLLGWVGLTTAGIAAAGTAYGAYQSKSAAEKAAKGGQVEPWGQTGEYMDQLLGDAMDAWNTNQFQFGPDPNVYNAYLGYGGKDLGLDLSGIQPIDPAQQGYGPEAYAWMLNLVQGPAWRGASQTNPSALMGVQNPWVAGLMGGLGGYAAGGGFGGGGSSAAAIPAITGSGPVTGVMQPTQRVTVDPNDIITSAMAGYG